MPARAQPGSVNPTAEAKAPDHRLVGALYRGMRNLKDRSSDVERPTHTRAAHCIGLLLRTLSSLQARPQRRIRVRC